MDELELTADAETGKPLSVNALAIALAVVIGGGLTVGAALVAVGVFNPHYVLNIVLWPGRVEIHCELPVLNPLYVVNMVLQLAMVPFAWGLWKGSRKAWLYLQLMLGVNLVAAALAGAIEPALLPAAIIQYVVSIILWAWLWEESVRAYLRRAANQAAVCDRTGDRAWRS